MTSWTEEDRGAFFKWVSSSLGQKFIRYLQEQRPKLPDTGDITQMAMAGATSRGFDLALTEIEQMARVNVGPLAPLKRVEVEQD